MAASETVDILMTIKGFAAECQTRIDTTKDTMLDGFQKGMFFEIRDFGLGVGLEDEDSRTEEKQLKEARKLAQNNGNGAPGGAPPPKPKPHVRKFSKWLNGEKVEKYPLDFQAFEFTRQLDKASPALFDACCNSTTIDSAIVVKRKVTGGVAGGGSTLKPIMTYLRIEFAKILIVSLDWDVDETVTEKVKFICRGAKVRYRPQNDDGSMGSEVNPGTWNPLNLNMA